MIEIKNIVSEDASPNPEFLIKSIAEQGYSLETALADLMDNSISANATKIEVLTKIDEEPFTLFISDNGDGMDANELRKNMQFPSKSPDQDRDLADLGRFGLGLKTASFSQTRCFTVLSRKKGSYKYSGLTWDVKHLKEIGKWRIIINSEEEIEDALNLYNTISENHSNKFEDFSPNTIVVWKGLYKFENYINILNKQDALKNEMTTNTSEYLSIVLHRFMEREKDPLRIRINNILVKPFNPFPTENSELRVLEPLQRNFGNDVVKIQGFVLPNSSIKETKEITNIWTPENKSLMDMEGVYIYRADRLILFGGWNGIIRKMPRLQLARLKVDIGNKLDHLFHLNVAKSQVIIPYDLKQAFYRAIITLKEEAQKEYYNYGIRAFVNKTRTDEMQLYNRIATNKGILLIINNEFPLLKALRKTLSKEQTSDINFILKITSTLINKVRQVDNIELTGDNEKDGISHEEIIKSLKKLIELGYKKEQIKKDILPNLGIKNNIPEDISNLLK
jgi:hypothetical protein